MASSAAATTRAIMALCFALRTVAWAALAVYVWWGIVFVFPAWSWEYHDTSNTWEKFRLNNYIRYHLLGSGDTSQTLDGWDTLSVLLWWFPMLVAALCTYTAYALGPSSGTTSWTSHFTALLSKTVGKFFSWQVPPRRWWLYWCDGLSVGEAIGVAAWVAGHIVGLRNFLKYYGIRLNAWKDIGFRNYVPESVLWLESISLAFSWLAFVDMSFLFLPISHNSFLALLTGLPYSALIRYHRWIGHSTMWMVTLHGVFYYLFWIADPEINFVTEFFDWGVHSFINVFAGSISFFFGLALWLTSINWVRRQFFEVFYKMHIVGFIGFVLFAFIHYNWVWTVIIPGLALYAGDCILRLLQSQSVTTVKSAYVSPKNQVTVMELEVEKGFSKCPLQELFLLVPSISRWQWHPFSIMSRQPAGSTNSSPATVTLAVKSYGSWTKELIRQMVSGAPVPVRVTGAMDGMKLMDLCNYSQLVLIAGGIAITPMIDLLEEIMKGKAQKDPAVSGMNLVQLVWVSRHTDELTLLPSELVTAASASDWLSIQIFFTGKQPSTCDDSIAPLKMVESSHIPTDTVAAPATYKAVDNPDSSKTTTNPVQLNPILPTGVIGSESQRCAATLAANGKSLLFPTASAFLWNVVKPVPSKSFGLLYTLAITTATFTGAFLGLVGAQPMRVEWARAHETPDTYYKYGITVAVSLIVQTIGLPMALVVLPVYTFRYLKQRDNTQLTASSSPSASEPSHVTTKEYPVIQGTCNRLAFPESGNVVDIQHGRPDLKRIVEEAAHASGAGNSIGVFCAGPSALMNATALLSWKLNDSKRKEQAHIHYEKLAFEL